MEIIESNRTLEKNKWQDLCFCWYLTASSVIFFPLNCYQKKKNLNFLEKNLLNNENQEFVVPCETTRKKATSK